MNPKEQVLIPSIGLIVVGIFGLLVNLLFLGLIILGASLGALTTNMNQQMGNFAQGVVGAVFYGVLAFMSLIMVLGGMKLRNLSSMPVALIGCIVGVIPCYHSCCILGIIPGIWGLVVIFKPEVQAAFKHVAAGGNLDDLTAYAPPPPPSDAPPPPPPPQY